MLQNFKKEDKAKCINKRLKTFTMNNIYIVLDVLNQNIKVEDDNGDEKIISKYNFVKI